jgi:hypothetical protein
MALVIMLTLVGVQSHPSMVSCPIILLPVGTYIYFKARQAEERKEQLRIEEEGRRNCKFRDRDYGPVNFLNLSVWK